MNGVILKLDLRCLTKKSFNKEIEHLINPEVITVNENTLHETLNSIYSFADDVKAIKDISKFEHYRRNYPDRYEWDHFQTQFDIPFKKNI